MEGECEGWSERGGVWLCDGAFNVQQVVSATCALTDHLSHLVGLQWGKTCDGEPDWADSTPTGSNTTHPLLTKGAALEHRVSHEYLQ